MSGLEIGVTIFNIICRNILQNFEGILIKRFYLPFGENAQKSY